MKRISIKKAVAAICVIGMISLFGCGQKSEYDFGEHFFRNSDYKDSVECVKMNETATLTNEMSHETNPDDLKEGETYLDYSTVIDGYDVKISYHFKNDKLISGTEVISGMDNPEKYIKGIHKMFEKNYGKPPVTIPYNDYHGEDNFHRLVYTEGNNVYIIINK